MDGKRRTQEDWAQIRADYEAGIDTVAVIVKRHNIAQPTLYARAAREGWIMRESIRNTDRRSLIERLAKMLERHITHEEKTMAAGGEKEVALLGQMARTLEKLIELDGTKTGKADTKQDRDIKVLRQKLAARIEQLKKQ